MNYTGIVGIKDICRYAARVTTIEKIVRQSSGGQKKLINQPKKYKIKGKMAQEELAYFVGRQKKTVFKDPISIKEIYPHIKHVYDENGVLIARKRNNHLRCTAKGKGRLIGQKRCDDDDKYNYVSNEKKNQIKASC